jgi:hypothetical protein
MSDTLLTVLGILVLAALPVYWWWFWSRGR